MKVCEICGDEYDGKDGDGAHIECEEAGKAKRAKKNAARRAREAAMRACGLVKVRGALGGIYWE